MREDSVAIGHLHVDRGRGYGQQVFSTAYLRNLAARFRAQKPTAVDCDCAAHICGSVPVPDRDLITGLVDRHLTAAQCVLAAGLIESFVPEVKPPVTIAG